MVSLLSHTAALAGLALMSGQARVVWVAVQAGVASIDLKASMAATPSKGEEEQQKPDPALLDPQPVEHQDSKPPVLLALADVDVTPVTREAARPAVPRAEPPSEVPETIVRPQVAPALEQRVLHAQNAPSDQPGKAVQSKPHVPRADVGRRLATSLVPNTASSMPSPGSVASRGAQSDIPTFVFNPAPEYPVEAANARQIGSVILRVLIAADGAVTDATLRQSSGVASLDEAALAAVRQWRFSASELGTTVRKLDVPINFSLDDTP
jgi:protein TonB